MLNFLSCLLQECIQLTSQCAKLQERTMALAKELAELKLCEKSLIFALFNVVRF